MSNKNIYLIVIIAAVAILSGCSANQFEESREKIEQDPSSCNDLTGEEKYLCFILAAESEGDPRICNLIPSSKWQEECFEEIAPEITNPEYCEKLKTQDQKDTCYIQIAKLRKDTIFCEKVSSDAQRNCQNTVIDTVARETKNENACITSDCLIAVAIAKKNSQICEKIASLQLQENIDLADEKENCYRLYAKNLNDIKICDKFEEEGERNGCYAMIARNTKDIKICKNIKVNDIPGLMPPGAIRTEEFKILNCYTAIAKDNPKKCDEVKEDSIKLRNECYREMSRITNNPELCKNIVIPGVEEVTCEKYFEYLYKEFNIVTTPGSGAR